MNWGGLHTRRRIIKVLKELRTLILAKKRNFINKQSLVVYMLLVLFALLSNSKNFLLTRNVNFLQFFLHFSLLFGNLLLYIMSQSFYEFPTKIGPFMNAKSIDAKKKLYCSLNDG